MFTVLNKINILSLDAPIVCCIWLYLFQLEFSTRVSPYLFTILFSTVWIIYVADRFIDAKRKNMESLRHKILQSKQNNFIITAAIAFVISLFILLQQETLIILYASILGICVIIYLYKFTSKSDQLSYFIKKKLSAAILFALGTTLPLWNNPALPKAKFFFFLSLFTLLCLCNLTLISLQENKTSKARKQRSLKRIWLIAQIFAVSYSFLGMLIYDSEISKIALFILVLNFINQNSKQTSEHKRLLADCCLSLPVIAYIMIQPWL